MQHGNYDPANYPVFLSACSGYSGCGGVCAPVCVCLLRGAYLLAFVVHSFNFRWPFLGFRSFAAIPFYRSLSAVRRYVRFVMPRHR